MTQRSRMRALAGHRLFWPCVTLILLCVLNTWFNPHFFHLEIRGGHLYGSVCLLYTSDAADEHRDV